MDEKTWNGTHSNDIRHHHGSGAKQYPRRAAKSMSLIELQSVGIIKAETVEIGWKRLIEVGPVCGRQEDDVIRNGGKERKFPSDFANADPGWIEHVLITDG
jgi:hypothetical protein